MTSRRTWTTTAPGALALVVLSACGAAAGQTVDAAAPSTATVAPPPPPSTTTSTVAVLPTTTTVPAPATWPLTAMPAADGGATVRRPAVVVKIDNDARARPQIGLAQADVVYELRVEGISRLAAVFHSTQADPVGPVRSARTSDPDLLAGLRTPLLAWSGGNPGVRAALGRAGRYGVLLDAGHDARPDDYVRDRSRRAPHNLFTSTTALLAGAPTSMGAPLPIFEIDADAAAASIAGGRGIAVPGAWVAFSRPGVASAELVWDARASVWRRFQVDALHALADSAHVDANGVQVAPTNVVILEVGYRPSPVDHRSPEAITLGSGRAHVLIGGRSIAGTWTRAEHEDPWTLVGDDGAPIALAPGRTWVELIADGDLGMLGAARAAALLEVAA